MIAPKIGDKMEFVQTVKLRDGFRMTAKTGVVTALRTVRQALVVDERKQARWVDCEILDQQPEPGKG